MNTPKLLWFIANKTLFSPSKLSFYGLVFDKLPVPKVMENALDEWPEKFFPPYCYGNAYLLTTDLMPILYNISFTTMSVSLEDSYIGVLAKEDKRIRFVHFEHNLLFDQKYDAVLGNLRLNNEYLVFGKTNPNDACNYTRIWSYILQKSLQSSYALG
jgi:hypothetical protein